MEKINVIKILENVKPYLNSSDEQFVNNLVYRTPAQVLRDSADEIERKDTAIAEFNKLLDYIKTIDRDINF